jgi:HEAT repeat protein
VPALLVILKTDKDGEDRQGATIRLGQIGADPERTVPALTEALKDADPDVRAAAANALALFAFRAKAAAAAAVRKITHGK